ncbi:sigma factor-like helix-turn-helix DNA-binding protein [Deinococcus sp.]|uniref:sigma factor-like helix-turn-helix DNA-binding protein n=1 Tax=Deinococcus sp. TaxID=47478 RepID=UPI003CC5C46C
MVKPGVYLDLPLPEAWEALLSPLRAAPFRGLPRALPSLGALVDACLEPLSEAQRQMVWGRLGAGLTLQEVGDLSGLTRERVRQVVNRQLRQMWQQVGVSQVLRGVRDGLGRAGAISADVSGASSQLLPLATPDELWRFMVEVWQASGTPDLATTQLAAGHWLFAPDGLLEGRDVRRVMSADPGFLTLGELAARLELPDTEVAALWPAVPHLRRGENGLFSSACWTLPDWIRAIAGYLAQHGVQDWHFSEMGRALSFVAPDLYPQLLPRNIAAVVSRANAEHFEYAGRKGSWRLRSLGDGHANNCSAIVAILEASDLPLHTRDIQERLERTVAQQTIYALLEREQRFAALSNGVFALRDRLYPEIYPEEDWLLEFFAGQRIEALSADETHRAAEQAGLQAARLQTVGRFSAHYRYWKRGKNPAQYLTSQQVMQRRFQGWYQHRSERPTPAAGVLLGGLQMAFAERDSLTLIQTYLWLKGRGVPLPSAAVAWVDWALGRENP